jgi:hypothetical protein
MAAAEYQEYTDEYVAVSRNLPPSALITVRRFRAVLS